ncbi:hypothetical protein ERJ75_000453800 [Trypanosoma vivax]|nr:hypothetical protein ERJ75_000453800 [Trypanosoma vivax]
MRNRPLSFASARLLAVLCFVGACHVSFCDDKQSRKDELKRKEKVFLCGVAGLYAKWNVTFGALRKRAEKVDGIAGSILKSISLYKNPDKVKHQANTAIKTVKDVINNTSSALNVNRAFMDGIERDFFSAFEAVKHIPDNYTFGHSNGMYNGKRESEILKIFKNVTGLLAECKTIKNSENVWLELSKHEVVLELENFSDLLAWEVKRSVEWNTTLENATAWLSDVENSTPYKTTTNIWKHNTTVWDTIKKDCHRVVFELKEDSKVDTIVNSSHMSILRHLTDVANNSSANSLEENGCKEAHKLFRDTVISNSGKVEVNTSKLKEMCKKLNETSQNYTCATRRLPIEWLRHRLNVTVPGMIERLNKSLTNLINAEKLVVGTFEDLFVSRCEVLCEGTRAVNVMNATVNNMGEHYALFGAAIQSADALLVSASHNIAEALNKSDAALKLASKAQNVINAVSTKFIETKSASDVVEADRGAVEVSRVAAREVIGKTAVTREELKKVSGELAAARDEKKSRLEAISKNFSNAFKYAKNDFAHDVNTCVVSSFVAPNVSIRVAEDVFAQLVAVNFSADSTYDGKLLENCTQKVETLKGLVEKIGVHSNAMRGNASKALQHAGEAMERAKEAEKIAVDVVRSEINKKRSELCAAEGNVVKLSDKAGDLEKQRERLYQNLSAVAELSKETANKALVAMRNCTAVTTIAVKAMITVLETANEADRVADANSSCAKAYANVANEDVAVQRVLSDTNTMKAHVEQVYGDVKTSLAAGKSQLEQMKKNFTGLFEFTNGGYLASVDRACSSADINVSELTLEDATQIYSALHGIPALDASHIEANLTSFENIISDISTNLSVAAKHHEEAETNAERAETRAKQMNKETRVVLKKALGRQRARLCDAVKRITEINNKTSTLQKEASAVKENVAAQLKRASAAIQRAGDAVTRAVAAEPHAAEATAQYQLTGEAARNTRIEAKSVVKNAAASLQANEEHIKRINDKFTFAVVAVSSHQCEYKVNVCKSVVVCNVTSGLEESLREIQNLTALMNITVEKEALTRLSLSEKNVKELMQETSRRANATEAAAAAALKAAEDSKCTPLYLQLLHVVDNRS